METVKMKQMEDELAAGVQDALRDVPPPGFRPPPPTPKKPEVEQLRDLMERRHASASDALTMLRLDRDTAILKVKADLKIQIDELHRGSTKKIHAIEADFDKKSQPLEDMIEVAEKLFD